ncbi:tripartite tricarboxylate transporter TctB family protein [Faunimonas sp. B44]|uniref:tripartite tricarboxylate transporter TctB family protein n=1 Tax=Faunimonas sp. B44 TaxID=3461493 RepID=UPI004044982E
MQENELEAGGGIARRPVEIGMAALLLAVGLIVIYDSVRLGAGWTDFGPGSGFFPFYIGLILAGSAGGTLLINLFGSKHAQGQFASWERFSRVLQMFIPTAIFITASAFIGMYVSAALFIAYFMRWNGRYGWGRIALIAICVPLVLFFIFERWFLVPLPKGPLENMLGL